MVSAHVVADAAGEIVEIHILASPDLHPKQMVRNVESALSAGLGLTIDRRIVSVAQLRTDVDSNGQGPAGRVQRESPDRDDGWQEGARLHELPGSGTERRLEFVRYESRRADERCQCQVVFRDGAREVEGTGSGPDTRAGRTEAAARAVFDGIGKARPDLQVELEAAAISANRGQSFVVVAAHAVLQRNPVRLAGAAPLVRSPEEAAILAALQAANRWSA